MVRAMVRVRINAILGLELGLIQWVRVRVRARLRV